MIQNVILHTTSTDVLLDLFRTIVKDELSNFTMPSSKENQTTKLHSRKEVAEILDISLPTLHEWTKDGTIKAYRIGTRVRYKEEDVQKALHEVQTYKHTRKHNTSK